VVNLFHYLTGHSLAPNCSTLLGATENQQARRAARIILKMNQLEAPDLNEAPCDAATEGVPVAPSSGVFSSTLAFSICAAGQEDPLEGEFCIGSADHPIA
jgi:polyphosphate kinase